MTTPVASLILFLKPKQSNNNCLLLFQISMTVCNRRTPECEIRPGAANAIHFFTKQTGAGDEIGWEFVDHVMRFGGLLQDHE